MNVGGDMQWNAAAFYVTSWTRWQIKERLHLNSDTTHHGMDQSYHLAHMFTIFQNAPKDKARTHQFGNKWLKGLFVGYDDKEGGGWSQRLLVVDWEEMDKAEKPEHIYVKPIPHKEVKVIKSEDDQYIYPLKQKMLKQPGSPKYEMSIPQQGIETSDSAGEVIYREANHDGEDDPEDKDYLDSQQEQQDMDQAEKEDSQYVDLSLIQISEPTRPL